MIRKQIKLDGKVFEMLEDMKDTLHDHASPQSLRSKDKEPYRMPFSWNDFFIMIVSDWRAGRSKCHCGHFTDCAYCSLLRRKDQVRRLSE